MDNHLEILDKMHCFHHLGKAFFKDFNTTHLNLPLNKTQEKVLVLIYRGDAVYMNHISKKLGLEKGSFTSVVDYLIDNGYLLRERDQQDRRKIALKLTSLGEETASALQQVLDNHLRQVLQKLTKEDKTQLLDAFHTIEVICQKL